MTSSISPPQAPNLPYAPREYEAGYGEQLNNALRLYFQQIDNAMQQVLLGFNTYGSFRNTQTQTALLINTPYPAQYDTTVEAFGVYLDPLNPSRVVVERGGVYSVHSTLHLDNTSGGTNNVFLWLRVNGVDVPYSTHKVTLAGPNAALVTTVYTLTTLRAGDYVELMGAVSSTNVVILASPASAFAPATASVDIHVVYEYPDGAV